MTLSGDSSASSSSSSTTAGLAQQHYHKVLELEQLLVTTVQSKGPFDPNVRVLRNSIREFFETIILEDHEFAELHDVEQSLWRLHHTRIEEFRARIRKSMASAGTAGSTPPLPGSKPVVRKEPVQKILAVFRSFLSEATGFYHDLILKIKAKHGLSEDDLTFGAINVKDSKDDDKRVVELKRCQISCHRCLIYLGDLSRYKEYYGDGDAKTHDWSIAAGFYAKAAYLWPASGNPYNQLAVLATYIGDEMLAVYHYFRSLASESPFLTAKDNLVILFEKNRNSYLRLMSISSGKPPQTTAKSEGVAKGHKKGDLRLADASSGTHKQNDSLRSASDIMRSFRIRVVRLNGILFTRTSLETFAEVHACVLLELEQLLEMKGTDDEAGGLLTSGRIWGTGPNVLFQLIGILIFTVHNVNMSTGPDSHQRTYAEILQRSVILEHASIATFECVGYLLGACSKAEDPLNNPLLSLSLVVMEWLSCRPEIAMGTDIKEKEGNARMFFWKNCVDLLNKFSSEELGAQPVSTKDEDEDVLILWEDHELWGFTPLQPIQLKLHYTKRPTIGLGSLREKHVRVKRLKQAGRVISSMFEGTEKGICYDAETDWFYLRTDKGWQEKKQADVTRTVEVTDKPTSETKDQQAVQGADLLPTNVAPSAVEEEDEELIVFKPSIKLKEHTGEASLENAVSKLSLQTDQKDIKNGIEADLPFNLSSIEELLCDSLPSTVGSGLLNPPLSSTVQSTFTEPANIVAGLPRTVVDARGLLAVSTAINGSLPSLPGFVDGNFKAVRNEVEPHLMSGWASGSNFGTFQHQQYSGTSVPSPLNWQPQPVLTGSALDLHKVLPSIGSLGVSPVSSTATLLNRPPFMEACTGYLQTVSSCNVMPALSESLNMSALSMANGVPDAIVETKPCLQELRADNTIGSIQVPTQDLSFTNPAGLKRPASSGLPNDSDKATRRAGSVASSGMRPPPGFGPLPAKPPVSISATSPSQSACPPLSGQPGTGTAGPLKSAQDSFVLSPAEDLVDDYGWLDGYVAPKNEASQLAASGQGGVSSYGWLTGGLSHAYEAPASPFPGMKPSDRVFSPPPLSTPQLQSPLPHMYLQQHLLQERRWQQLQQLYKAQLAAQQNSRFQHSEQPQELQSLQQSVLGLQQQPQQAPPVWPSANSFVS